MHQRGQRFIHRRELSALAAEARVNLAALRWTEVRHADGKGPLAERFDAILVNAGVTHPLDGWLDALADGGRRRLLASTNRDVNVSEDDGQKWEPAGVERSLPWAYCRGMAPVCGRPGVVLLGNGDGPPGSAGVLARSDDGGQTWREADLPGRANSTIWNFAVNPADPDLVYASSVSGEAYQIRCGSGAPMPSATWLTAELKRIRATP